MPKLYLFLGYAIYFWSAENGEPVHVHVAKGRPTKDATKIWLTRSGGCTLASNGSRIGKRDLANVMDFVTLNHAEICSRWKDYFHGDISFHE